MTDRLAYEVHPGTGRFALFLPGTLGTRSNWAVNVPMLAKVCRPVVAELWGHGRSPSPVDLASYEITNYVAAIDHIREELGADDWFVVGQSFGGALGAHLALARPDTVRALVLTNDVMLAGDAAAQLDMRAHLDAWGARYRGPDGAAALRDHPAGPSKSRHVAGLDPRIREAMIGEWAEIDRFALSEFYDRGLPYLGARDRVRYISCPVLVLNGTHEERFGPVAAYLAETIPDVEVVDLACHHVVNSEAWRTFNSFVSAFLRRHG